MPRALIVGCNGQDGTYLSHFLRDKGYDVLGIDRVGPCLDVDVCDAGAVVALLQSLKPDEVYYLAAFHHSAEDGAVDEHELIVKSLAVNTLSLNNFLYGIAQESPASRLFYAASCRVFGKPEAVPQDEATPMNPVCAYGISKAAGIQLCRYYRRQGRVYSSAGILYNHESPRRPVQFITRKIAVAAAKARKGLQAKVVVGDLDARVDWGYAPDYVAAMWAVLQLDQPDDFIVATGQLHSVRDFAETAFGSLDLSWQDYVIEDASLLNRRHAFGTFCGDARNLQQLTGWRPRVSFEEMVREMVAAEMQTPADSL